jgi:hypothetical protein
VNSDYVISPMDVLGVVNFLNSLAVQAGGEGESSGESLLALASPAAADALPGRLAWEADQSQNSQGSFLGELGSGFEPSWWLPEQDAGADDFADVSRPVADSSLEGTLDDGLADDIASAWGLGSEIDDLLADLV